MLLKIYIFVRTHNITEDDLTEETLGSRYGIIISSANARNLRKTLEQILLTNPKKQIILLSNKNTTSTLKYAWNKLQMMNILSVYMNQRTENKELELPVYFYNPFPFDHFGNRGIIVTINISHMTYRYRSKTIWPKMLTRYLNVYGYPIKICIFEILGLVQAVKDNNGEIINYKGMDAEIVWMLLEASNFSRHYISPPAGHMFGGRLPNGSSSGQLWVMENQLADIAANTRMIQDYGSEMATFLQSTGDIDFNFMTPELGSATRLEFLKIFDNMTYFLICISYASILTTWIYIKIYQRKNHKKSAPLYKIDIIRSALIIFGISTLVSQTWPKSNQEKFLLTSMILVSMVLGSSYQGIMYKMLASEETSLNYETLKCLEQSNLELLITLSFKPNSYVELGNFIFDRILKKATFVTDVSGSIQRVMQEKNVAMMIQETSLEMYQSKYFDPQTGSNIIHKVEQSFKTGPGGYMTHKMSPFQYRLNDVILNMLAGGLTLHKEQERRTLIYLNSLKRPRIDDDDAAATFKMSELSVIFKAYFFGLVIGICVFIIEIIFGYQQNSKVRVITFIN